MSDTHRSSLYLTDESLFAYNGFNPHQEKLYPAFEHARRGDYRAAKEELVKYYRARRNPLWLTGDKPGHPLDHQQTTMTDEDLVTAAEFPERWRKADVPTRIELIDKRRSEIGALAAHYQQTGSAEDAACLKQITKWLYEYGLPPSLGDARGAPVRMPHFFNPLHCCGWVAEPFGFLNQMRLLLQHDHLDGDTLGRLVSLVTAIARSVMLQPAGRNAVLVNCLVLMQAGIFLPELTDSYWWRRTGVERATGELHAVFYPDGGQAEHTEGYNAFSVKLACNILKFIDWVAENMEPIPRLGDNWERSRLAGLPLPPQFLTKYRQAIRFLGHTALPNSVLVPVGDITSGTAGADTQHRLGELGQCYARFPEDDMRWLATNGREGAPPQWTSAAYPYMGYFVMRSGWDPDARYGQFDSGGMGEWHGHDDKLSVLIYGYGRLHVRESSYYGGWFGSEHNVFMVDGIPPHRRHGHATMDMQMLAEPYPYNRWQTTSDFDYAYGRFDEGFANPDVPGEPWPTPERLALWKRTVFFSKPDVFFVTDFVAPRDGKAHKGAALFHLSAEDVKVNGNAIETVNTGPSQASGIPVEEPPSTLAAYVVGAGDGDIVIARDRSEMVDALGVDAIAEELSFRPYPILAIRRAVDGPVAQATVFIPVPVDGKSPVAAVEPMQVETEGGDAVGMRLRFEDGRLWTFVQAEPEKNVRFELDGDLYDADALLVRKAPDGSTEAVLEARGEPLQGIDVYAADEDVQTWLDRYRA